MPPKRKHRDSVPEPNPFASSSRMMGGASNRRFLIAMFFVIAIGGGMLAMMTRDQTRLPTWGYKILRTFDHDDNAFTQGLCIDLKDGTVYESTGQYGQSSIRRVDLETGKVEKSERLGDRFFGEGLADIGDRLVQLTWKEGKAFVWSKDLKKLGEFDYVGNGWGLTYDGQHLIMSDGTTQLLFRDPVTFEIVRKVTVTRNNRLVAALNELEYVKGKVYANQLDSDNVYVIDPVTGKVLSMIDLSGLWPASERPTGGVLNGIAVNPKNSKMIVTGKYCPYMYEIELVPVE